MILQKKIDEMKASVESRIPKDALAVMHRETADLKDSGILDKVMKKGAQLPGFSLSDQKGDQVISGELLGKGPLVISFYRGVW